MYARAVARRFHHRRTFRLGQNNPDLRPVERLGITVISSDVVRKQLAKVPLTEKHHDEVNSAYTHRILQ
jgi:hypothetical protein